jgi:RHS repeat-associated protein
MVEPGPAETPGSRPSPTAFLPSPTLPKGGGAIRGIGERLSINPARGTCSVRVPVATSPGRADFGPALQLGYDSGSGNSPYGLGWRLDVPSISRKTDKGLPRYTDQDTFLLTGDDDLVPSLIDEPYEDTVDGVTYVVERFRPRTEAAFTRIERCRDLQSGAIAWRTVSRENVSSWYGRSEQTRIFDPDDASRVFQWLLEEVRDDRGNIATYEYKAEDNAAVDPTSVAESHRLAGLANVTNRYLKRIRYGNRTPGSGLGGWHFTVVLDYGDHDGAAPTPDDDGAWPARPDAFSTYRPGFEVRTWRLCRRVLMFHDFPGGELGPGPLPRLVRSTDLIHDADPAGVHLLAVAQTSYRWTGSSYEAAADPPVEFEYTRSEPDVEVRVADPLDVANLPSGVDDQSYRWVDLDGEGLSGVLSQRDGAWYYKRNLGDGRLGAVECLPLRPSTDDGRSAALVDLAADGRRSLVLHGAVLNGYQERDGVGGGWLPFTPFASVAAVALADTAARQTDLTGDGLTDILIPDGEVIRWHAGLGRAGYALEERVVNSAHEDRGPVVVWTDPASAVVLADMCGDGLADIVRVRNGEVCYWPNLGYGRFGPKVTMSGAPGFDHLGLFEPARLRFADIDGSGATDVVYLGRGAVTFWPNLSGNSFGVPRTLAFPDVDRLSVVDVVDLLGTGTSCLVWSSPLPTESGAPLRYLDLCHATESWVPVQDRVGHKPNLLCTVRNNVGAESRIAHAPSTRFYLADAAAGTPWATRLPFPVHVVERLESFDHVARTRLVTTYRYRHGYFDGPEREFRGFGLVETSDAESFTGDRGAGLFAEPAATELHRPPVRTRTWFHTGAFLDEQVVSTQFRDEYYGGDSQADPMADSELPDGLTERQAQQARRALAGHVLRTEVYADDGEPSALHPYAVTEHRYRVEVMQAAEVTGTAVFRSHALETVTHHYERNPADPRVSHDITVEVDPFNAIRQSATIGYPRRVPTDPEQSSHSIVWTVTDVTHSAGVGAQPYRLGTPVQARTYEVTGLVDPLGERYTRDEVVLHLTQIASAVGGGQPDWEISYEEQPSNVGHPQRRLVEHVRVRYWNDALDAALPLGAPGGRALVRETHKIAFTPGLLSQAFGDLVDTAMLIDEAGYVLEDGAWWIPSGVQYYDPSAFYLPQRLVDPFGNESSVDYDAYNLLVVLARASQTAPYDVLTSRATCDYRLLVPHELTDPNGNRSSLAFDVQGRVMASWVRGKDGSTDGDPLDLPGALFTYDAWSWHHGDGPVWAHTETRERHGDSAGPWQRSRAWSDGSGRIIMTKRQAEPGPAWTVDANGQPIEVDTTPQVRWVGTGRTVFDNKAKPVKKYEPYFSPACVYEDEAALVEQGITPVLHYDPLGRLTRIEHPDGTLSRVSFDPWRQESWDASDTVLDSRWYADRGSPDPAAAEPTDPATRAAWLAAKHANTPVVSHLDSLGRTYQTVADGGPAIGGISTLTEFDIEGNVRSVTDARGVIVLTQVQDLAGRVVQTTSPDAGPRWTLPDVTGAVVREWDGRGHAFRRGYDRLRRPVETWVREAPAATEILSDLNVYGEAHAEAVSRNLRGRVYLSFDGAGMVMALRHDFKGNLLAGRRRMAREYHAPANWSTLAALGLPAVEAAAESLLEAEHFASAVEYDALNRPTHRVLPDTTVLLPGYNEAGMLATVSARLPGDAGETPFVTGLHYDAKGQRLSINYANGVHTQYTYEPLTYRLSRLETLRASGGAIEHLQDLRYTYDSAGNVVEVRDGAQQAVFFAGQVVTPSARYTYDPLYRLVAATGREHASLGVQPDSQETARAPLPHPNDMLALRNYRQSYAYDHVGNIMAMVHEAGQGSWTRQYSYADDSNRLLSHTVPGGPGVASFTYDPHGNMTSMPHLAALGWNHTDQLSTVDLGGGGTAYYVYDSTGQRVRKVIERLGGLVEERLYLGGYEVHRRRLNGSLDFERRTIHIMDDERRIALVETLAVDDGAPVTSAQPRVRYQLANHLGSCCLEVDNVGAVISYEEYHPHGTTSLSLATGAAEVSVRRYRYTGKEKDDETELYYHGARYYACWLARWLSADPAGLADGTSRYRYARNQPINLIDPAGSQAVPADRMSDKRRAAWKAAEASNYSPESVERLEAVMEEENDAAGLPVISSTRALDYATVRATEAQRNFQKGNWVWGTVGTAVAVVDSLGAVMFADTWSETAEKTAETLLLSFGVGALSGYAAPAGAGSPPKGAASRPAGGGTSPEGTPPPAQPKGGGQPPAEPTPPEAVPSTPAPPPDAPANPEITPPNRQLASGGKTTLTQDQVQNAPKPVRGRVGEVHKAELSGGTSKQFRTTTTKGIRYHDVTGERLPTSTLLRREVKNYLRWVKDKATGVWSERVVKMSARLRAQINKDVAWIAEGRSIGEHRVVQWDFVNARPDPAVAEALKSAGLPYTEVVSSSPPP